tara:strand:+ start:49 stop:231 length:183 start_codon:yes stop_codon:yes gene_type:complete
MTEDVTMQQQIQIESTGRGSFWRLTLGGTVVGWANGYQNAVAKRERYERARASLSLRGAA